MIASNLIFASVHTSFVYVVALRVSRYEIQARTTLECDTLKIAKIYSAIGVLLVLSGCGSSAPVQPRSVTSLLEIRRDKMIKQSWDISCGSAALATVLTYDQNYPVTEREVAAELLKKTPVEKVRAQLGFSLLDLKNFVQSRGFTANGLGNVSLPDLLEIGPAILPVIVHGYNHFVVFRDVQGDRVLLADPAWGNRTMRMDEFLGIWKSHVAFTVERVPINLTNPPVKVTFHPMSAHSRDFVASSNLYQRRDIEAEALRPDEPETKVASASQPALNAVIAGTGNVSQHMVIEPEPESASNTMARIRQAVIQEQFKRTVRQEIEHRQHASNEVDTKK